MVFRRDPITGDVESDQGSLAFKYHHMGWSFEIDALAAKHYGDTLLGVGAQCQHRRRRYCAAMLVVDVTDDGLVPSLVTSFSQSWIWGGKNVSGVAEYFYNGLRPVRRLLLAASVSRRTPNSTNASPAASSSTSAGTTSP